MYILANLCSIYTIIIRACAWWALFNTLRPRQNGRHFPDDIFKWMFLNENVWISIKISLKFVPKGLINNIPALVQIMAWRPPGDKPLFEPMMVSLPTHICVTRPQWDKKSTACNQMTFSNVKPYMIPVNIANYCMVNKRKWIWPYVK